ncbi:MAG: hypothetical protein OXU23_15930 [Candidatus Poribacteria bacterium]|nr:hypothetical protein [Candidatus Poribacteria bacterium]
MWQVTDKWGNRIELTNERWRHILENHWELRNYFIEILLTVRTGERKQSPTDPFKYTYDEISSRISGKTNRKQHNTPKNRIRTCRLEPST